MIVKKLNFNENSISNIVIFVIYTVLTFLILSTVYVLHSTTFFTNLDNVDQFYSWYQKLSISLHGGQFPLWNPNTFGGQSFAGEIQQGIFYPINIVFVWLFGNSQGISHLYLEYLMGMHFVLGSFGMYLVLQQIKISKNAAFLSGLVYSFSGVVATRAVSQSAIFFGLCLLPYPLFFLLKYYQKNNIKWIVFTGISLGLIILSGHVQPFFHAFMLLIVYELLKLKRAKNGFLFGIAQPIFNIARRLLIILVISCIVALPQLFLSAQYIPNAYRVQAEGYLAPNVSLDYGHFAKSFNIEPHEIANFINPEVYPIRDGNNLFIGLFPLSVVLVALLMYRKQFKKTVTWKENSLFVKALFIISVLAMLGYWTWFAVLLYELPFVRQVRQLGRYSIIFHFALMIILAISIDVLVKVRLNKKQVIKLFAVALFLAINFVYIFMLSKHIFNLKFALQILVTAIGLFAIAAFNNLEFRRNSIILLIVATTFLNSIWFLPKSNSDVRLPKDYEISSELKVILEKTHGKNRIEITDNALPVNIANKYKFEITGGYGATIYAPYYEFSQSVNIDNELKRDLLGVLYLVSPTNKLDKNITYNELPNNIYVGKRNSALGKLFTSKKAGSLIRTDYETLDSTTETYDDNYQKYKLNLDKESLVIFSEIQYPGWILNVNGNPVELQAYNIDNIEMFKSVKLKKGEHTIELMYRPFSF